LNKLKERPLSSRALSLAKKQLVGQIALAREHRSSLMIAMAKSLLFYNEVESFQEIHDKIQAISERDLLNVSQEVFDEENLSSLAYHPKG
jgi:predicted Zn-dependent peptidase